MSKHEPGAAYRFARTLADIDPLERGFHWWMERGKQTDDPAEYLGRRLQETAARVAWINDFGSARRRGLERFGVDERMLDVTRERIAQAGGITAELDAELGRPRRGAPEREDR